MQNMNFKTIGDFEKYCYHDCPIGKDPVKKIGCRLTCEVVNETRRKHPSWFGKSVEEVMRK